MEGAPKEPSNAVGTPWIRRIEWAAAILLSAVALLLFFVRMTHAGSLWRDEAESVQSARMPLGEMFDNVQFTSFPILFPLCLRAYTAWFGTSDISLRCFGLTVGVFMLAASWLLSRQIAREPPLLLPAIIALNTHFLIAGTSLRGYGLGAVLVLLAFAATAKFLLEPSWRNLAAAFVAALISMQCLFFNGVLLAAIVVAVAAVLLLRDAKWVWPLMGVAAMCGLSYVPYLWQFYFHGSSWAQILQVPISFALLWQKFLAAWGEVSTNLPGLWLGFILLSLIGAVCRVAARWTSPRGREFGLLLFALLVIPTSTITSCVFLRLLPRAPEERYFLALSCLLVASADVIAATFCRSFWVRVTRIVVVVVAVVTLPFAAWPKLLLAESNVHVLAETVEQDAGPADLVVVNPWTYGVSFNWYYNGMTRWITVPEIDDHRIHRYDLLLRKMASVSPLADLENVIGTTLKSGNRVWLVGQVELAPPGNAPLQVSPAPDPQVGWQGTVYRKAWSQEIGMYLWQRAERANQAEFSSRQLVSARENMLLFEFEGWRD